MKPEKILARTPKVLCQSQREQFFHDGYLVIDQFIGQDWLDRLWAVTHDFVEESRKHTKSNEKFDLEPEHSAENPRLRRLSWPTMQHAPNRRCRRRPAWRSRYVSSFEAELQMVRRW